MSPNVVARLQILAAATLFSTGGVAIKSCELTGWQVASFRSGLASLALWLMLRPARDRWNTGSIAVGAACAATLVLYALANKMTTAANAIFLQSTSPLFVLLLSPWLLGETIRRRDLLWIVSLSFGMALFFVGQDTASQTAPNPGLGNILGAGAGFCWALTVIGLRWLERGEGRAAVAVVAANFIGCVVTLPMALPVLSFSVSDGLLVAYLGVFQIAVAYVLMTHAVQAISALEVALLLLVEPILNPIWVWWVHGEVPGRWALVGGAIVLLVTSLKTWGEAVGAEG